MRRNVHLLIVIGVVFMPLLSFSEMGTPSRTLTSEELKALDMLLSINTYLIATVGATVAFILPNGKHFFSLAKKIPFLLYTGTATYVISTGLTFCFLLANQYTLFNQIRSSFIKYADLIGENWIYISLFFNLISFVLLSALIFKDQYENELPKT